MQYYRNVKMDTLKAPIILNPILALSMISYMQSKLVCLQFNITHAFNVATFTFIQSLKLSITNCQLSICNLVVVHHINKVLMPVTDNYNVNQILLHVRHFFVL